MTKIIDKSIKVTAKSKKKKPLFLSWLQLRKERVRLLVAIAGISFADVLMFLQMGFRGALFSSAVELHHSINGEIVILSSRYRSLISQQFQIQKVARYTKPRV